MGSYKTIRGKMKIKTIILLSVIIIFFSGCEELIGPPFKEKINSNYFPLSIGNKWYYKYWDNFNSEFVYPESIAKTEEIISTKSLNNKLFFLVEHSYLNLDGSVRISDSVYLHMSGDTLYQLKSEWKFEEESLSIAAIFADSGNVNFQMKWYDYYYEVYSRFETDSTMNFVYYVPNTVDSGSERQYKRNIGICDYISYQTYGFKLTDYKLY
jgi:hypothetical protein